jgi:hypothetical protein
MPLSTRKIAWIAASAGAASLTGSIVQRALEKGWRTVADEPPPDNLTARGAGLSRVLLWTAGTAAVVSVAQVLAARGALAGWKRVTGKKPPR